MKAAVVVCAADWGSRDAAPGMGFHSPEHPGLLRAPYSGRRLAGVSVAVVVSGGAGVISAAPGIFWTPSSVIRRALLHPVFVPRVVGEAPRR